MYYIHHRFALKRLGDALAEFGENPEIFREAMSRYRYIVRSTSRQKLLKMAGDVQRTKA